MGVFFFLTTSLIYIYEKKLLLTPAPNRLIWKMSSIDVYSVDILFTWTSVHLLEIFMY